MPAAIVAYGTKIVYNKTKLLYVSLAAIKRSDEEGTEQEKTMSMHINHQLPAPADLKNEYPLSASIVALKKKEIKRFALFLLVNWINLLFWWVHAPQITKMLSANTFPVWES